MDERTINLIEWPNLVYTDEPVWTQRPPERIECHKCGGSGKLRRFWLFRRKCHFCGGRGYRINITCELLKRVYNEGFGSKVEGFCGSIDRVFGEVRIADEE